MALAAGAELGAGLTAVEAHGGAVALLGLAVVLALGGGLFDALEHDELLAEPLTDSVCNALDAPCFHGQVLLIPNLVQLCRAGRSRVCSHRRRRPPLPRGPAKRGDAQHTQRAHAKRSPRPTARHSATDTPVDATRGKRLRLRGVASPTARRFTQGHAQAKCHFVGSDFGEKKTPDVRSLPQPATGGCEVRRRSKRWWIRSRSGIGPPTHVPGGAHCLRERL